MTFREKIQFLRKSRNMTQEKLAEQVSVSRQAISKWELGESMPDIDNILQLSKLFEVSTDYLLNDEIENYIDNSNTKRNGSDLKEIYYNKILIIVGVIFTGVGLLGNLILWILSTMIKVPVTKSKIMPDGRTMYYGGGDVLGYNFWSFISEYRLMAIILILSVLFLIGITMLFMSLKWRDLSGRQNQIT